MQMISNSFIHISIPNFQEYLLNKFNIDIYEIPTEDWKDIIYNNYCKNIINSKFCLKKCRSIKANTGYLCSKCCEKKKLKRDPVYKKKKKIENVNNDNIYDSGFYTEAEDNIDRSIKKIENEYLPQLQNTTKKIYSNSDIQASCNNNISKENKNVEINYIKFGDLDFELDKKYIYLVNNIHQNIKSNKTIINHNYINDKYITFGELNFKIGKIDKSNKIESVTSKLNIINNIDKHKKIEKNLNSDLYYLFIYFIDLIFQNHNVEYIQKKIYRCLGGLGIQFYRSQFNNYGDSLF